MISVLDDLTLEVRVVALGERARVVCVPAVVTVLPPPRWEAKLLARDWVLMFINFCRYAGAERPPPLESVLRVNHLHYHKRSWRCCVSAGVKEWNWGSVLIQAIHGE